MSYTVLQLQLIESIKNSINYCLYENASFLCERLCAEVKNEETKLLLAECYIGDNKYFKAYHVLKDPINPINRYKFALVCLKLNKPIDAEKALNPKLNSSESSSSEDQIPCGAAGLHLMGIICERSVRPKEAIKYYSKALEIDPTLWVAFEKLSKLSTETNVNHIFNDNSSTMTKINSYIKNPNNMQGILNNHSFQFGQSIQSSQNIQNFQNIQNIQNIQNKQIPSQSITIHSSNLLMQDTSNSSSNQQKLIIEKPMRKDKDSGSSDSFHGAKNPQVVTIEISPISQDFTKKKQNNYIGSPPYQVGTPTPNLPIKKPATKALQAPTKVKVNDSSLNVTPKLTNSSEEGNNSMTGSEAIIPPFSLNAPQKEISKNEIEISQPESISKIESSPIEVQKPKTQVIKTSSILKENKKSFRQRESDFVDLMQMLRYFGNSYKNITQYKCQDAIYDLTHLPEKHHQTGWVLGQIGRCFTEIVKYSEAEKVYQDMIKIEPYRVEGLDQFSTCLWHLKKQVDLCWLSNHVLELTLFAPETWVVVGNCFSLQKEHEVALKFFNRAIQLNPNYAYAYTLCGHEYRENEDFENAKLQYQRALTVDDKHYNAWWGLGNVSLKQEKFEQAIQYFKSAIKINNKSPILITYMGMTYTNAKKYKEALVAYDEAEKLDPHNPLNKFKKAELLSKTGCLDEAQRILEQLCQAVPKEYQIHFELGKLYKKKFEKDKALAHFRIALDLEQNNSTLIKSYIENIDKDNEMGDESDL